MKKHLCFWLFVLFWGVITFPVLTWGQSFSRIPDTGQSESYTDIYGEDSDYIINPPSYTKLDAAGTALPDSAEEWTMVRDNVTGLVWEVKQNKDGIKDYSNPNDADNTYTWYDPNPLSNGGFEGTPGDGTDTRDFTDALNQANFGSCSLWRLPTLKELNSIRHFETSGPSINANYFPNAYYDYWSSSTHSNPIYAWPVGYSGGFVHRELKSTFLNVRGVCGALHDEFQDTIVPGRMLPSNNGTVYDSQTGLTWQQQDDSIQRTWESGLDYCETLSLADYEDWRMPNINELISIVDLSDKNPAIDPAFINTQSENYMSSTNALGGTNWHMYFGLANALIGINDRSEQFYVRCVRGGTSQFYNYSVLSAHPDSQDVTSDAGSITINVINNGNETMPWSAQVISGDDWLSIVSGGTGSDQGTIICEYGDNPETENRMATIRITAYSATNGPVDVTVNQDHARTKENIVLSNMSRNHVVTAGSEARIYGTSASNHITLEEGAQAELINFPGGNTILFELSSNLFTVYRSGAVVTFAGPKETVLKIPATTQTQTISFIDKAFDLTISNGHVILGDQIITTTSALVIGESDYQNECGAYIAPGVWKEFDCYNLAAIGKETDANPFIPSWDLIGGYWQWGRKGPDPSHWYNTNTPNFAHGPNSPAEDDANSGSIFQWDRTYAPSQAWSDAYKTDNDPCPEGFRVPTASQWDGVIKNNPQINVGWFSPGTTNYSSARFFGEKLMLPAADHRGTTSGNSSWIGNSVVYWSSEEDTGESAKLLYYQEDGIIDWVEIKTASKLSGVPIRCIAE